MKSRSTFPLLKIGTGCSSKIALEKNIFLFLDCAYHGLGDSLDEDIKPLRYLFEKHQQLLVGYSFSKNFGLYGDRTGLFIALDKEKSSLEKMRTNICEQIRTVYSVPPLAGSRVVKTILSSPKLKTIWHQELADIRARLKNIRQMFVDELKQAFPDKDYDYILSDKGLFSLLGFTKEQVLELRDKEGIYLTNNSRVNIAALSKNNIPDVVKGIKNVVS